MKWSEHSETRDVFLQHHPDSCRCVAPSLSAPSPCPSPGPASLSCAPGLCTSSGALPLPPFPPELLSCWLCVFYIHTCLCPRPVLQPCGFWAHQVCDLSIPLLCSLLPSVCPHVSRSGDTLAGMRQVGPSPAAFGGSVALGHLDLRPPGLGEDGFHLL